MLTYILWRDIFKLEELEYLGPGYVLLLVILTLITMPIDLIFSPLEVIAVLIYMAIKLRSKKRGE